MEMWKCSQWVQLPQTAVCCLLMCVCLLPADGGRDFNMSEHRDVDTGRSGNNSNSRDAAMTGDTEQKYIKI